MQTSDLNAQGRPWYAGSWIITASGRRFDFARPDASMVDLGDIAHALSNLCRFGGHVRQFYSVAQHSVVVLDAAKSLESRRSVELGASAVQQLLLHDATEAYMQDLVRPLKTLLPDYARMETRVWRVIAERFGLPVELHEIVQEADRVALETERRDLLTEPSGGWRSEYETLPDTIVPWSPDEARTRFLNQCHLARLS